MARASPVNPERRVLQGDGLCRDFRPGVARCCKPVPTRASIPSPSRPARPRRAAAARPRPRAGRRARARSGWRRRAPASASCSSPPAAATRCPPREPAGLLLLSGAVAREVALEDTVSTELLGPGDVILPAGRRPRRARARGALAGARRRRASRCSARRRGAYPEIACALLERLARQAERLATVKAISQLNSVERRLLGAVPPPGRALGARHRPRRRDPAHALAPAARRADRRAPPDRLGRDRRALDAPARCSGSTTARGCWRPRPRRRPPATGRRGPCRTGAG